MQTLSGERTIGEIVAADYRTAAVFERHGIDFCCGGKVTVATRCQDKGLELETIMGELAALQEAPVDRSQNYAARVAGTAPATRDREIIRASLSRLHREHEAIGDAIHKIRHLAQGYVLPDDACNTFMLTYRKLKEFEDDLHKHVHLENNILFPKAAAL